MPTHFIVHVMQLFLGKLKRALDQNPPPEPSSAAINLELAVGRFEVHFFAVTLSCCLPFGAALMTN